MTVPSVKTLIVDVDDTISTHTNRDYENARPHLDIITKLNRLYDEGWTIIYHTARGQVSCAGDIALIEETKRPVLEAWLKKHNVKYHQLMFGKPIGAYYIDDKAITPDEFMKKEFRKLEGGSGATIEVIGDRVIKRGKDLKKQVQWYGLVGGLVKTPKIYNFFDDTIDMEFVDGISLNQAATSDLLTGIVNDCVNIAQSVQWNSDDFALWSTMVGRVQDHLEHNAIPYENEIVKLLNSDKTHTYMNGRRTMMHGDFTLSNMILRGNDVYYIDPNYIPGVYSSYILDFGKLYQSLHHSYEETFMGEWKGISKAKLFVALEDNLVDEEIRYATLAELVHYIRMIKYKPAHQKQKVLEIIEKIYKDERLS